MWLALLGVGVVCAVALARAFADVDEAHVREWAAAHGLALSAHNRPMVWWYLRNARVLRTLGVLGGLILPPLATDAVSGTSEDVPGGPLWIFVGYFVGALYAEISLVRPRSVEGAPRSAALTSRDLRDYLPRRLLVAQRAVAIIGVGAAVGITVAPYDDTLGTLVAVDRGWLAGLGLAAAALTLALPAVERWLVRRPQPWVDGDLIAADDAIRAQSVHSVAGSGIAVALCLVAGPLWGLAQSDVQILRSTMGIAAFACFPAALVSCLYYGHRAWRVRRAPSSRAVPAAP